jgi:hypothetical protein
MSAAWGAATITNVGGAMPQYMMLVYQEEADPAEQPAHPMLSIVQLEQRREAEHR